MSAEHERKDQYEGSGAKRRVPVHDQYEGRSYTHGQNPGLGASKSGIRAEQTRMWLNKTRHFIKSQFPGSK